MAEVIKYGVIWDLFARREQSNRLDQRRYLNAGLLQEILVLCVKADVVSKDEKRSRAAGDSQLRSYSLP